MLYMPACGEICCVRDAVKLCGIFYEKLLLAGWRATDHVIFVIYELSVHGHSMEISV